MRRPSIFFDMIPELNERSQAILRYIVDAYMQTGDPVGSRTISEHLGLSLSSASIRNVMADLEARGLLFAPHTSAGRMPTQEGLRFYVDGLMQVNTLSDEERSAIEGQCKTAGQSMSGILERATTMLSGLSAAAGLVVAPKTAKPVRQIQFVKLDRMRILVILVTQGGLVENRVMETEIEIPESELAQASNYLTARLAGSTLQEAEHEILREIEQHKSQLSTITADLVKRGIALSPAGGNDGYIIIRGQSNLLSDVKAIEDLEKARQLMAMLEEQETIVRLVEQAKSAEGVQIYIGTENKMFEHSGWSMVISPYKSRGDKIVGAIGVIGPTRLNYSRVIPIIDYTSKVMEKLLT